MSCCWVKYIHHMTCDRIVVISLKQHINLLTYSSKYDIIINIKYAIPVDHTKKSHIYSEVQQHNCKTEI